MAAKLACLLIDIILQPLFDIIRQVYSKSSHAPSFVLNSLKALWYICTKALIYFHGVLVYWCKQMLNKTVLATPIADAILEIPASELELVLKEAVDLFNQAAELVRDAGILRGRDLARMLTRASDGIKATRSPTEKLMLVFAYLKQLLAKIREALKSRPAEGEKVLQVCSKIQARAVQIIEYLKVKFLEDPAKKKDITLDSQQARILFSGAGGGPVSRKETIRSMRRAEALWPALKCGHRPNDGRQTMRLTGKVEELQDSPVFGQRDLWQRSARNVAIGL